MIGLQPALASPCIHKLIGHVHDEAGHPLGFTRVDIQPSSTSSVARAATVGTDGDGVFRINELCPGIVSVMVQSPGFSVLNQTIRVPETTRLELILKSETQENIEHSQDLDTAQSVKDPSLGAIEIEAAVIDPLVSKPRETTVLKDKALRATRGNDLARAVESVNGARSIGTGNYAKPVVRGQNGNRISILQNGTKHLGQKWGLDHAPEIDPFSASSVAVVQGAATVAYGPDAIGGVVILDAPEAPLEPRIEGDVDLVGATNNGQGSGSLSIRGRLPGIAKNWTFGVQSSFTKSANQVTPRYDLDNTASEIFGLSGQLGFDRPGLKLKASYNRYDATLGIFSGIQSSNLTEFERAISSDLPAAVEFFEFSYDIDRPFQTVTHDTFRVKADIGLSRTATVSFVYSYQVDERRERDRVRERLRARPQAAFDLVGHSVNLRLDGFLGSSFFGTIGGEFDYIDSDYFGTTRLIADSRSLRGSAFGVIRYLKDTYEFELGARIDTQTLDTDQAARVNASRAPRIERDFDFVAPTFTAGSVFKLSDTWNVRAQLATAARMPSVNELTIDGGSPGTAVFEVGNSELGVETSYDASVLISGEGRRWRLSLSVFGNYIQDYIYFSPQIRDDGSANIAVTAVGVFPVFDYRPVDAGFIGTNLEIELSPFKFFTWRGRASVIRAQNLSEDTALLLIPSDRFENRFTFSPFVSQELDFFVEHIFTRRQDNFDLSLDFAPPPDGYQLVNLGLSASIELDKVPVRISADIRNLFNKSYRDYLSRLRYFADEAGRNLYVRVSIPFGITL